MTQVVVQQVQEVSLWGTPAGNRRTNGWKEKGMGERDGRKNEKKGEMRGKEKKGEGWE